jgi:hypothetical protein
MERSIPRYGVHKQTSASTLIEQAIETIRLLGYAIVDGNYTSDEIKQFSVAFDCAVSSIISATAVRRHLPKSTSTIPFALSWHTTGYS